MTFPLFVNYPSWIHPEIFPNVPVLGLIRWYGLMYVFAFIAAYIILKQIYKEGALETPGRETTEDDLVSFMGWGIVFLLIGARIFSTLVYDRTSEYWKRPYLIFWPFDSNMKFTGLAGMSYHGGFIGGLLGIILWCKLKKRPFLKWIDAMAVAIPLGYTFGRLGNFLNGELYGRITTAPWGVIFPGAQTFSSSLPWVQDFAAKIGLDGPLTGLVNLPRHPSQLYEAFFEGLFLWAIMFYMRKKKPFDGFFTAFYITGYGLVRFIIEYFRMPDADIGYVFSKESNPSIFTNSSLLNISTGQVFCFIMIVFGIAFGITTYLISKKRNNS